jgi:hypothetical protein
VVAAAAAAAAAQIASPATKVVSAALIVQLESEVYAMLCHTLRSAYLNENTCNQRCMTNT